MINKNKIKYITSLQKKKFRQKYNKFIIEGYKTVSDILNSDYKIDEIFTCDEKLDFYAFDKSKITLITDSEMKKISNLKTPSKVLAVAEIKETKLDLQNLKGITLCLDDIQDPGNFGTIIRTANWFGVKNIVCSTNTVDLYNPKTLQSTMGAFAKTNIFYTCLADFLKQSQQTVYGTFMNGKNLYNTNFKQDCIIVLGNEGNGISEKVENIVSQKITIPDFAGNNRIAESLNVAIANAVILSEIKSQNK